MRSESQTVRIGAGFEARHLIVLIVLLFFGIGAAVWLSDANRREVLLSGWEGLPISETDVQSEWPVPVASVRDWVQKTIGKNLFLLDAGKLMEELSHRPWVESVTVKKVYPNRLRVGVKTKQARAISLVGGQPHFLDEHGNVIERVTPSVLKALDLPFLVLDEKDGKSQWDIGEFLKQFTQMKALLQEKYPIAQIVLGRYPFFKTFLVSPKIEVIWSVENWESQIPNLLKLLTSPPSQVGQLQRINLVFPKKAVVSSLKPQ